MGSLVLDASNDNCFGIAWNGDLVDQGYLTNDFTGTDLYYTEDFGTSWVTYSNPAGSLGRGMAFDGTDYWQADRDGGSVWRFQPGVGAEEIAVPEVSGTLSACGVFPMGGNLGVIVGGCHDTYLHFYEWDGVNMDYLGSDSYPVASLAISNGVAYYEVDGSLYWSYRDTGNDYHLAKLAFDITSLEQYMGIHQEHFLA